MTSATVDLPALPDGLRWATGGGSPFGGCNGLHIARGPVMGTLCGLIGPATPRHGAADGLICGNCARIARVPRELARHADC